MRPFKKETKEIIKYLFEHVNDENQNEVYLYLAKKYNKNISTITQMKTRYVSEGNLYVESVYGGDLRKALEQLEREENQRYEQRTKNKVLNRPKIFIDDSKLSADY